jgi:hypothetical protein
MNAGEWIAFAVGAAIGVGCYWVRDKFMVLEYKIGELENPERSKTNAEGQDGDIETDDVKGNIGFWRSHGRT